MKKLRVGLLFGGRSEEHEVSIMSAKSVYQAADRNKYEFVPLAISKNGVWLSIDESRAFLESDKVEAIETTGEVKASLGHLLSQELDVVFPLLHGPYGEDGKVQGLLDLLNIPYVGSGVLASAVGMDKSVMKQLFALHHLPQVKFLTVYRHHLRNLEGLKEKISQNLGWPCFIKPANLGSSIGISKVYHPSELAPALNEALKYDRKLVIEEFIPGRELECSVLGNQEVEVSLPGEIIPSREFYDYEAKYQEGASKLIIPAAVEEEVVQEVKSLARKAFQLLDCRGLARVDFFLDRENKLYLNELNTIPGFTRYSMYPKLWEVSGLSYASLIDSLIELALKP